MTPADARIAALEEAIAIVVACANGYGATAAAAARLAVKQLRALQAEGETVSA